MTTKMNLSEVRELIDRLGPDDLHALCAESGWTIKSILRVIDNYHFEEEQPLDTDVISGDFVRKDFDDGDATMYYDMEREEGDPEELDFN